MLQRAGSGVGSRPVWWGAASAAVLLSHGKFRTLCATGAAYVVLGALGRDAADVERLMAVWLPGLRAASCLSLCGLVFFTCHGADCGALLLVGPDGMPDVSCVVVRGDAALGSAAGR
jgi:hypothetical protein